MRLMFDDGSDPMYGRTTSYLSVQY